MSLSDKVRKALTRDIINTNVKNGIFTFNDMKPICRYSENPEYYYESPRTINAVTVTPNGDGSYNFNSVQSAQPATIPLYEITLEYDSYVTHPLNNYLIADVLFTSVYIDGVSENNKSFKYTMQFDMTINNGEHFNGNWNTEDPIGTKIPWIQDLNYSRTYYITSITLRPCILTPRLGTNIDVNAYINVFSLVKGTSFTLNNYMQAIQLYGSGSVSDYIYNDIRMANNQLMFEEYMRGKGMNAKPSLYSDLKRYSDIVQP